MLACGCSARQARDTILLTAGFLLPAAVVVPLCEEVPTARWFVNQREALGLEAAVYAFMAVGSCDEVVQWGFDETTLDGTACFNQWCLVRAGICFGLVFAHLLCHVFQAHTSSWDDAAARPEMGQMCVDANGFRSHPHICGPVPDLQPHHPKGKWVEGQLLFFGLHHRDEVRLDIGSELSGRLRSRLVQTLSWFCLGQKVKTKFEPSVLKRRPLHYDPESTPSPFFF